MDSNNSKDFDPVETQEWLDALDAVKREVGPERVHFLLQAMMDKAYRDGTRFPFRSTTAYLNSIPVDKELPYPGDIDMERRIQSLIRWNAVAMVLRAGRKAPELGGHIASYASASTLYEVGFNHFFHAPTEDHGGDFVFVQGHSSPGIYARAFLEGRLTEEQLDNFRQEVDGKGISSYPHPWLMQDFWQFPTVSMGLGPIQAIYQARFLKYLENRGLAKTKGRKVWMFCGDGEMDEPESLGALSIAVREKLDNLIIVVNCNLQRLDGPVRGNGKIIQELEGTFRGAGWNVLKVIWGNLWNSLLATDKDGLLLKRMEEAVDGDYQNYKAHNGAYVREHFFGKYPELKERVANMSDDQIWRLNRGGHDHVKVFNAYAEAVSHEGQPTVILAKTVKGFGLGASGEGQNVAHNVKKMKSEDVRIFRDRFSIPITDEQVDDLPFYRPSEESAETKYIKQHRAALGGYLPGRRNETKALKVPELEAFAGQMKASGDREISTTMAFVRILNVIMKDKNIGPHVVPIIPDECRTFGMEGMFRQYGIYSPMGQLYTPVDAEQVMFYKEDIKGQVLEEGINEAGGFCSWLAAGTSYTNNNVPMIPFYIYYSMFSFQRCGDLAWTAGDMQAKGFLLGGTAGRTTLAGEGLQHQDGHSHILAGTIPNCVTYDPTYGYELAVIIQDGLRRMYQENEHVFYYITVMNENYIQPEMPEGAEEGIIKGMYLLRETPKSKPKVQLLGSGTILLEVIKAADILQSDYDIASDIWSVTSFNELRREALAVERENRMHPDAKAKLSFVEECLMDREGPVIAATDYMKSYSDQIRAYIPQNYVTLGTDGFGRSDTRERLRHFFEVDAKSIVLATLNALADDGKVPVQTVKDAIEKFGIDPNKPNPTTV